MRTMLDDDAACPNGTLHRAANDDLFGGDVATDHSALADSELSAPDISIDFGVDLNITICLQGTDDLHRRVKNSPRR